MNEIIPFQYEAATVRTLSIDGEPWFVAKDVCGVLGLTAVDVAIRKIPDTQKDAYPIRTPGGTQRLSIISEAGLYRLIMRSDKDEAEPFIAWVTEEVLPTIRKTGGVYMTLEKAEEMLYNPDLIIGMANQIKQLAAERDEAIRTKAHISDKKTATAVGRLGGVTRQRDAALRKLKKEQEASAVLKLKDKLRKGYVSFTTKRDGRCAECAGYIYRGSTIYREPPHAPGGEWGEDTIHAKCFESYLEGEARDQLGLSIKNDDF